MRLVMAVLVVFAGTAHAQVADQVPAQSAGAIDVFGERPLRIRGGARIEVEARVPAHVAVLKMEPDGTLQVVRVAHLEAKRNFDVPRPRAPDGMRRSAYRVENERAGTVILGTSAPPRGPPPAAPLSPVDGILIVLADIPLDSAAVADRLGGLTALEPDSVASMVGRLVAGPATRWAAYYQKR